MRKSFGDFIGKKERDALKQLGLMKKLLEKTGLKVESYLETDDTDDPYIFCFNPSRNGSFDGIRIYKAGDRHAYRIQKENRTHPYGKAYSLEIEEMFHDLLSEENEDQRKAGEKVIEIVTKEVKKFFDKSVDAEKEDRKSNVEGDSENAGNVLVKTTGTDYSSLIFNKT